MVWLKSDLKSSEKPSQNVYLVVFFLCWSLFRFPQGAFSSKPPSPEEILTKSQQIPELSTLDIYSHNFLKAINKNCKLCLNCENLLSICGQLAIAPLCVKGGPWIKRCKKLAKVNLIPDICHFFTRTKFLKNKIYTEKRQFFALNL